MREGCSRCTGALTDLWAQSYRHRAQVVGARGLRAADSNGLSDPYVVVRLGDAAEQTRVVPECLDPDWNETFVFSAAQVSGLPDPSKTTDTRLTWAEYTQDVLGCPGHACW